MQVFKLKNSRLICIPSLNHKLSLKLFLGGNMVLEILAKQGIDKKNFNLIISNRITKLTSRKTT
jgi:hypothetical protein